MREFVIKQWKGLGFAKAQDPLPEESSPPDAFHEPIGDEPIVREPIVIVSEPAFESLADFPRPRSMPAEDVQREEKTRAPTTPPRVARRRGERNFVVAYEGRFVGVFEAQEELTPREAFVRVAGDLSSRKEFNPDKLQLFKPVLLRSARPPKGSKFVSGKLTEIGGRIHEGPMHGGGDAEGSSAPQGPPEARTEPATSEAPVEEKACLQLA